jgi:hypothetical protein
VSSAASPRSHPQHGSEPRVVVERLGERERLAPARVRRRDGIPGGEVEKSLLHGVGGACRVLELTLGVAAGVRAGR